MKSLTERQPALISTDANNQPVVIPAGELRAIRDGRHSATNEQVQGMARYIINTIEGKV